MGLRQKRFSIGGWASLCLAAVLHVTPASATVCGDCSEVKCGFSVESLSWCGAVASNHELILRPTCLSYLPEEAFPSVYLASGERIDGYWELLPKDDQYRDPRYRFSSELPENSEVLIAGPVQAQCAAVNPDNCASPSYLACPHTEGEDESCCSVYEAAGLEFGLGSRDAPLERAEGRSDLQIPEEGAGGGTSAEGDAHILMRFFTTKPDETAPAQLTPLVQCGGVANTTNESIARFAHVGVDGSLAGVAELTFHLSLDGSDAGAVTVARPPCVMTKAEFEMGYWVFQEGVNTVRVTARDFAGNTTAGSEISFSVPEDCMESTSSPDLPVEHQCDEPELPRMASCTDAASAVTVPDLCGVWGESGGTSLQPEDDGDRDDGSLILKPKDEGESDSVDSPGGGCSLGGRSALGGFGFLLVAAILVGFARRLRAEN